MSSVRQPGPRPVPAPRPTPSTKFQQKLSLLPNDSQLQVWRYISEQPSISSHISLGDSGYQTLKSRSSRLILDNFDEKFGDFGNGDWYQAESSLNMMEELDSIIHQTKEKKI